MIERLNPVASLTFIRLDQVKSFSPGLPGKILMQTTGDLKIPFAKGAVSFNYTSSDNAAGILWTSTLSGVIKSQLQELGRGILIVEVESGERLIIGDPMLPVTINLQESLMQKSLQISHKSHHKPYILTV